MPAARAAGRNGNPCCGKGTGGAFDGQKDSAAARRTFHRGSPVECCQYGSRAQQGAKARGIGPAEVAGPGQQSQRHAARQRGQDNCRHPLRARQGYGHRQKRKKSCCPRPQARRIGVKRLAHVRLVACRSFLQVNSPSNPDRICVELTPDSWLATTGCRKSGGLTWARKPSPACPAPS